MRYFVCSVSGIRCETAVLDWRNRKTERLILQHIVTGQSMKDRLCLRSLFEYVCFSCLSVNNLCGTVCIGIWYEDVRLKARFVSLAEPEPDSDPCCVVYICGKQHQQFQPAGSCPHTALLRKKKQLLFVVEFFFIPIYILNTLPLHLIKNRINMLIPTSCVFVFPFKKLSLT